MRWSSTSTVWKHHIIVCESCTRLHVALWRMARMRVLYSYKWLHVAFGGHSRMRILFTATLSTLGIFFVGRLAPPCQVSFGQRLCSAACSRRSQARPAHSRSLSLSTHSGRNILKIVNYTQRAPPSIDIPVSLTSLYLLQHSHLAMTLCENSYSSFCRPRSTSNRCSITMLRTFIQEPVCLYKKKHNSKYI